MTDDVVHLDRVKKRFGKITALDNMDIRIKRGEFVTFLGPSGCGKSTTLRILGGFERPDSGTVYLSGQDVTHLPPNRRKVNMVFQDYALFPHMTVAENLAFPLEVRKMGKSDREAKVKRVLDMVQMGEFGGRRPAQLSGGQQQRVFLARALAQEADLYFMDEPFAGVDAATETAIVAVLRDLRDQGKTLMVVHHDLPTAKEYFDSLLLLNMNVVAFGPTSEVFTADKLQQTYGGRLTILSEVANALGADTSRRG